MRDRAGAILRGEFGRSIGVAAVNGWTAAALVRREGRSTVVEEMISVRGSPAVVAESVESWRSSVSGYGQPLLAVPVSGSCFRVNVEELDDDDAAFDNTTDGDDQECTTRFGNTVCVAARTSRTSSLPAPLDDLEADAEYSGLAPLDMALLFASRCAMPGRLEATMAVSYGTDTFRFEYIDGAPIRMDFVRTAQRLGESELAIDSHTRALLLEALALDSDTEDAGLFAISHAVAALSKEFEPMNLAERESATRGSAILDRSATLFAYKKLLVPTVLVVAVAGLLRLGSDYVLRSHSAEAAASVAIAAEVTSVQSEIAELRNSIIVARQAVASRSWLAATLDKLAATMPDGTRLEDMEVTGREERLVVLRGVAKSSDGVRLLLQALEGVDGTTSVRLVRAGEIVRKPQTAQRPGPREAGREFQITFRDSTGG
jgi:Tfp pilus assembly protein PilN